MGDTRSTHFCIFSTFLSCGSKAAEMTCHIEMVVLCRFIVIYLRPDGQLAWRRLQLTRVPAHACGAAVIADDTVSGRWQFTVAAYQRYLCHWGNRGISCGARPHRAGLRLGASRRTHAWVYKSVDADPRRAARCYAVYFLVNEVIRYGCL